MSKKLFGVLVDVENEKVEKIEIEDSLKELYRVLDCKRIDIVPRKIGSQKFNIVYDDEGLFKKNPKVSALNTAREAMFVGNLLVVSGNVSWDGELQSLTESEATHVQENVQLFDNSPVLSDVEF